MSKRTFLVLLLVLLIFSFFSLSIYSNILKEKSIKKELNKIDYYNISLNETSDLLLEELPNNNLTNIYSSYLNLDQITIDIDTLLNVYFTHEDDKIKENFKKSIESNFKKEELESENVKDLINNLVNTYYTNIFPINNFNKFVSKLPYVDIAKASSFILLCTFLILIIILLKKGEYATIYLSLFSTGIVFILPKVYLLVDNFMINFYYFNKSFSYFIKEYFYSIVNDYFITGIILIILSIIEFVVIMYRKKK